jgi:hypothetical protein
MSLVEQYREQAAAYEARGQQATDAFQRTECERMAQAYRRLASQAEMMRGGAADSGASNDQQLTSKENPGSSAALARVLAACHLLNPRAPFRAERAP